MRRRMILVLSLTLLGMLAILTATTRFILLESFTDLEHRYLEKDVERALSTLRSDLAVLDGTALDWAAWDDTYAFAASRDSHYAEENLSDDVFSYLRLNVMLFLDTEGKLILGKTHGLQPGRTAAFLDSLLERLSQQPEFLQNDPAGAGAGAVVRVSEAPLLLVSRPITDNTRKAPARGTLLMGRLLDPAEVQRLGERLGLSLAIAPPDDPAAPADIREAPARLASAGPILIAALSRSQIAGYALIPTGEDTPGLVLRVVGPRDIAAQGMRSILYLVASLLLIAVVFGLVVILYIEKTILSRILALSRGVLTLGTESEPGKRVSIEGRDQIAYLGAAVNGMLDALEKSTRRNEAFLDAIPDTIFRIDREGNIIDARSPTRLPLVEAADALVGKGAEEILLLYPFISPERLERSIEATTRALATGTPQSMEFEVEMEGTRRFFQERIVASGDSEAIALVRDVTASKQAEEAQRKEILLREIHHRVKNNLQVISSLLALQAGAASDPHTRSMLGESRDRVRSMALIHEKLYQTGAERGVTFAEYARDLAAHLRHSYAGDAGPVEIEVDVADLALDMDLSVPCGLIINELLSNALKHAFPDGRSGRIRLGMRRAEGATLVLSVSDDGIGFPQEIDLRAPRTLGLRIVNILATQIRASLALGPGPGTSITLTFPEA
jgi:two-component sensor histidine kinase/sensor domain CHASE-containing protein